MSITSRRALIFLLIVCGILAIDQASKWAILEVINLDARPPIRVTRFFGLVMVWNYGVSFGMFAMPGTWVPYILKGLAIGISAVLTVMAMRSPHAAERAAFAVIVGGALGNLIDRIRFGAVADFLYFHIGDLGWPAFNIADSAIFLGVTYLIIRAVWPRRNA